MRLNLKVPFAEKDQAKKLGARWDAARKVWYVDGKDDLAPFARWSPSAHDGSDAESGAAPAAAAGGGRQSASQSFVGSRYVAQPRVCDCAPWELCDKCSAQALSI